MLYILTTLDKGSIDENKQNKNTLCFYIINLNMKKAFKIISIYSATDIPENAAYKKKSDTLKK